eukprot:COSAG01_NODE_678_length_14293_cov_14.229388_8_plen_63_part_00
MFAADAGFRMRTAFAQERQFLRSDMDGIVPGLFDYQLEVREQKPPPPPPLMHWLSVAGKLPA